MQKIISIYYMEDYKLKAEFINGEVNGEVDIAPEVLYYDGVVCDS